MKQFCAISIDMDPIGHYLSARGHEPLQHTNLNAVYDDALPKFLDFFDEYQIKATFFIVGKDLVNKKNGRRIRKLCDRGHETANHTYSHFQHFHHLDNNSKKKEIEKADKIISDVTGKQVVGFRAPGWGIDAVTLKILEENNYSYDSSVFPSKLLSIIAHINWILNRGKLKRSLGRSSTIGLAPKFPYRPNGKKIWKRGDSNILEIPLAVLPLIQFPFLGTTLYLLGKRFFKISLEYFNIFNIPLIYSLHGIELVDYYESINDKRLSVKPGIKKYIEEKKSIYNYILTEISKKYSFTTMNNLSTFYNQIK